MPDRFVMLAPASRAALLRGMDMMTGLLRPTLGPAARTVAIARIVGSDPPEVLDSAATIARRTIQLEYPFEDMGAMLVRQMVWKVFEEVGDGAATAAVIAQRLVHAANRYVAAGGNAMLLKRGIERGLDAVLDDLNKQATKIELPSEITSIVSGIVRNQKIAEMLGEVMDSVGPDGSVLVEEAQGTETGHEYIDGVRWNEGYVSHFLLREGETEARIIDTRIFVTDIFLDKAEQLVPVVEACVKAGERNLFVIAPEVKESALALLIVNREKGILDNAVAVKAPAIGTQRTRILEDIAVATGGRCLTQEAQDPFDEVMIHDLGTARQAWATRFHWGILGGGGSKGAIRQRINEAKAELRTIVDDDYVRNKIKERIGKLAGAAAVVRVGAPTKPDRDDLKFRVEAAVTVARSALQEGVVPGGGAAYVAAARALESVEARGDEAVGLKVLAEALEEPMRAIAENAGLDPSPIVHEARRRGPGWTFDIVSQEWVEARSASLVDPLPVTVAALKGAVSAATMAMTTDVLIRHKKPDTAVNP
jgi:chaperonin GroEL